MSYYYSLYDMVVCSDILLAGCIEISSTSSVDVIVQIDHTITMENTEECEDYLYDVNQVEAYFYYATIGLFKILKGSTILVKPDSTAPESLIAANIIGTCMGILFYQRNTLVIHGSSIEINGQAILFSGESRFGKSTLAFSLIQAGHRLITDDVAVVYLEKDSFYITPSFPNIKVSDNIADLYQCDKSTLHQFARQPIKKRCDLSPDQLSQGAKSIKTVIFPFWGTTFSYEQITPREAMTHLLPKIYGPAPRINHPKETKELFYKTSKFTNSIPCFKLTRPYDINKIKDVSESICEYINKM